MRPSPLLLSSLGCLAACLVLLVSPLGRQGARCLANHVHKDDQCTAAALRDANSARAWRTGLRFPRAVLKDELWCAGAAVEPWVERFHAGLSAAASASGR